MGIVVTIAMLAGLIVLLPSPVSIFKKPGVSRVKTHMSISILLLVTGLWNAVWYGLQHLESFWGRAACISGVLMIAASVSILLSLRSSNFDTSSHDTSSQGKSSLGLKRRWFDHLLILGLLLCFLLYFVTLVQLNLGMDIIN